MAAPIGAAINIYRLDRLIVTTSITMHFAVVLRAYKLSSI